MVHYEKARKEAAMDWWTELDYPAFDKADGGDFPRTGQVVKHYRQAKKDETGKMIYSQKALADELGIKPKAVWNIENKDSELSFERRIFLAGLLDIPLILFGLADPSEIDLRVADARVRKAREKKRSPSGGGSGGGSIIETSETYLARVNEISRYATGVHMIRTTTRYMNDLHAEFLYVSGSQQRKICELLYRYHIQLSCDWRNSQQYDEALHHLNKADLLADHLNDNEFRMVTLLKRGTTLFYANRYQEALEDYQKAQMLSRKVPDYLNGICLVYTGPVLAKLATTQTDRRIAIATIQQGGEIVQRQGKQIYSYGLDSSIQRFYLDLADSYYQIGRDKEALNALKLVQSKPDSWWRVHHNFLNAQINTGKGEFDKAADWLLTNTRISKLFSSPMRLAQHRALFKELEEREYNDSNMALLGRMLKG